MPDPPGDEVTNEYFEAGGLYLGDLDRYAPANTFIPRVNSISYSMVLVEICTDSHQGAVEAIAAGADRIELCVDLEHDGLTPPDDMLDEVLELGLKYQVPIFPMVRCRPGGFVYNRSEKECMLEQAESFARRGVPGLVVGAITAELKPDIPFLRELCERVREINLNIEITFHKAIDQIVLTTDDSPVDLAESLSPYCDRVLTSGGATTAVEGVSVISQLVKRHKGPIPIAAGKIRIDNVELVIDLTGVDEVHSRSLGICEVLGKARRDVLLV